MKACFALSALIGIGALALGCEDGTSAGAPAQDGGGIFEAGDGGPPADGGGDGGVLPSCPSTPTTGPTNHEGTITGTETWTADKSPHIVPADLTIVGTLTIERCAEVLVGAAKTITVGATGKLLAEGDAGRPIKIRASDATKPFAQLRALNGGTLRMAYVDLENGGDPQNGVIDVFSTIQAQGSDQNAPAQPTVFVDNVTIKGSRSNGLHLADGAGFAPGSQNLTVTGSANFAMSISPRAAGTIPSGKYTGNKLDEIVLPGGGGANAVQEDTTLRDRGVPYRIGNSLTQGYLVVENLKPGGTFSTLTIDPGVTLRFKQGAELVVETFSGTGAAHGALVAVGTPAKPIIFTSAAAVPAAGDWIGISFNMTPASTNKVQHARVEYAGGLTSKGSETCNATPSIPDAAIKIGGVPSSQFVTNTTIMHSAAHGIDRGWRDDNKQDFAATNVFTSVTACNQTHPKNTDGSCPDPVPCPK